MRTTVLCSMKALTRCLLGAFVCLPAVGQPAKQVTVREARQLVMAALPSKTIQLRNFELETGEISPDFYSFSAYWAGAPNGSMVIGHYAVDKTTADVWNAVMACQEMRTSALRKLQASVRSRIGLSEAEYQKRKRTCPLEMPAAE